MIARRGFITLLGGAAAWPILARAQQGDRVRRIGVLTPGEENDPLRTPYLSAFTQALADLGWAEPRNVRMDVRWASGDANRMRALAQELVGLKPDIIVTIGTAIAAIQRETQTIPIVFANVADRSSAASSPGSASRAGTPPASPPWKPRWEASGLNCSRRLRLGSSGPQSCSIPTLALHRLLCPRLRRRPGHSRSCQSLRPFTAM